MEITVLGRYGPFPAPEGACSGYIVKCGELRFMLDMGSGCFTRLYKRMPMLDIDFIILSHLHADHMGDMLIFRYALSQLSARGAKLELPLPVISPSLPAAEYGMLATSGVFDMTAASDGMTLRTNGVHIRLERVKHSVPTYAVVMDYDGSRLVYTGDTGYFPGLIDICRNADTLLADANYLDAELPANANHMSASQSAKLARDAGVKRLILTHIWGGGADEDALLKEAKAEFEHVTVAREGETYGV